MDDYADLLAMYDRAMADCGSYVARTAEADLGATTPCADWDLGSLVAHMIGQNEGFAAAVQAGDADISMYDSRPVTRSSVWASWSGSAQRALEAFRSASADRQVTIAGFGTFPARRGLRMQLLDTIIHTWDVATALGAAYRPADDLVSFAHAYAVQIAEFSPDGQPGVFAAPLAADGVDDWVDALRLLGRAGPPAP